MNIWADGLSVLVDRAWAVFSIFITIVWGQVLIVALLRKNFKTHFTNTEYISLGLAGWILPVAFWAVLLFAGIVLFGEIAEVIFSVLAATAFLFALIYKKSYRVFLSAWMPALAVSVLLQLAFLEKTILPLYFDSAEHYRIVKFFAGYPNLSNSAPPLTNYYHVGFHLISAAVSRLFRLGIVDAMLVFGQIVLAVLPFSLFFIVKQETQSNAAAAFTCLLAGLGWHMPSHLVNWGKYPALFSLLGIHFVLNIGYLIYRNKESKPLTLRWLLAFGVLVSALTHTRSLIVFFFMAISTVLTAWRNHLPVIFQRIVFVFVAGILAFEFVHAQKNALLAPLLGGYLQNDGWMVLLAAFLTLFSIRYYSDLTLFLLASFSFLMLGLFVPAHLPRFGTLTLLDRPYLQMLLYLPLSIFGGLGLAGLHRTLQGFSFHPKLLTQLVTLSIFGLVVWNAKVNHDFYPSDCCQTVSRDDLTALQWMDKTIPPDAKVLIAATNLLVTSFESPTSQAGVDGGIWITPLTSRTTIPMRGETNFDQPEIHAEICRLGADFIYAGGMPQSFNALQLDEQGGWYQLAFFLPAAKVYQVIGCE